MDDIDDIEVIPIVIPDAARPAGGDVLLGWLASELVQLNYIMLLYLTWKLAKVSYLFLFKMFRKITKIIIAYKYNLFLRYKKIRNNRII